MKYCYCIQDLPPAAKGTESLWNPQLCDPCVTVPQRKIAYTRYEGVWGKSFPPAGSKGRALGRRRQTQTKLPLPPPKKRRALSAWYADAYRTTGPLQPKRQRPGSVGFDIFIKIIRRTIAAHPKSGRPDHQGCGLGIVKAFDFCFKRCLACAMHSVQFGLVAGVRYS